MITNELYIEFEGKRKEVHAVAFMYNKPFSCEPISKFIDPVIGETKCGIPITPTAFLSEYGATCRDCLYEMGLRT